METSIFYLSIINLFKYCWILFFEKIAFKNQIFYKFLYLIILINLFLTFNWMIINHPHQYVYFNNLVPKKQFKSKI